MGSVFSKTPRTARSYPIRSSIQARPARPAPPAPPAPGPAVDPAFPSSIAKAQVRRKPEPQAQERRASGNISISHDDPSSAVDPSLAAHLRKLGPVTPYPTRSNTSTYNFSSSSSVLGDNSSPSTTALTAGGSSAAARAADSVIFGTNNAFATPTAMNQAIHRANPALTVLEARERLARQAEEESDGSVRVSERQFANVGMLRDIVGLRGRISDDDDDIDRDGENDESGDGVRGIGRNSRWSMGREEDGVIEKRFGLKNGVVGKLGKKGVVESV